MTVVLPFFQGDVPAMREWLGWVDQLGGAKNHEALLVADCATQWSDCLSILELAASIFGKVELSATERSVTGWPAGSNALFRHAAEEMNRRGQPFLWIEPDAIPLKAGWLDTIANAYKACGKPFMGRLYKSDSPNTPPVMLSGIAVYPADTIKRVAHLLNNRAWDVCISEAVIPQSANTHLIQWFWGHHNLSPTFAEYKGHGAPINTFTTANLEPDAVLFHRNKDGTLMRLLKRIEWKGEIPQLTVVLPFCSKDSGLAYKCLEWIRQLRGPVSRNIVLHYDATVPPNELMRIRKAASNAFRTVHLSRYPAPRRPYVGWPAACNYAFRLAATFVQQSIKSSWFWFEADAVAIKADWLEQIEQEYAFGGKPFMGSVVGDFDGMRMGHINGTAVYPRNALEYFPKALANYKYPWDAGMRDEMIHLAHRANHLIQHCGAVIDGCCKPANGPQSHFGNQDDVDRLVYQTSVVFHPSKDGTLIDRLRERHAHGIKNSPAGV